MEFPRDVLFAEMDPPLPLHTGVRVTSYKPMQKISYPQMQYSCFTLLRLEREHAGVVFEEEQLERFRQQREECSESLA